MIKKILGILLVVLVALVAVGCGDSDEDQIKEVGKKYYDALFSFDVESRAECILPGSDLEKTVDINASFETLLEIGYKEEDVEKIKNIYKEKCSYKIVGVEIKDDTAVLIVDEEAFSSNGLEESAEKIGVYQAVAEKMGCSSFDELKDMARNGKINVEEADRYLIEEIRKNLDDIIDGIEVYAETDKVYFKKHDGKWYISDVR